MDILENLYRKRDRALERVVAAWGKDEKDQDYGELDIALDALAVAPSDYHATFLCRFINSRRIDYE